MDFGYDIETLKTTWGVYAIINQRSYRQYIGHTADCFFDRWKAHWFALRAGKHENVALQWDWLFFGERVFKFCILESYTERPSWRECRMSAWSQHREAVWIARTTNLYNAQTPAASVLAGERARRWAAKLWIACYGSTE